MNDLKHYISEAYRINKNTKLESGYKYFPKTKDELLDIIKQRIEAEGNECNFNNIDVSKLTDMSKLFYNIPEFNGDISEWDVSNVKDMCGMFSNSKFNGDISKWDVSNVKTMLAMFSHSKFNGDISNWNVSNVENMRYMFWDCKSFNQDISKWDVSNVVDYTYIFDNCPITEKYKPKFK